MKSVGWIDLCVDDASGVKDFYAAVMGWTPSPVSMGSYDDYSMLDSSGESAAGVCHASGPNADLPPVWMPYFQVADIEAAAARVVELGGEVLRPVSEPSSWGRNCFIKDPAGVVCALFEAGT